MQTPNRTHLEVLDDAIVAVDVDGTIVDISSGQTTSSIEVDVDLGPGVVLLPGMVDAHLHAPQWPQLGTGLDLPLERWLFEHTFPLERRLTDPEVASQVWPSMVSTLLAHGTTTVAYYATIDVETTTMLAQACHSLGQRALVGRVAMDHPEGTPEWYRDVDAATGIDDSRRSIDEIRALESPLVAPIITPRFAPACSDEMLAGLGRLAAEMDVPVQTHCSESDWEHGYAFTRFGVSDTDALHSFGLVRPHTILAHCDHVSDGALATIATIGAGIAHCPLSNAYFGNAVFPARRALDAGVTVGLGSDVAGGARPGVLAQCADAVTASRHLEDGVDPALSVEHRGVPDSRLSIVEAFWMATVGGAALLDVPVGRIAVGRSFDAFAVDTRTPRSPLRVWPDIDDAARIFEKVVRLTTPAEITDVWVAGRRVAGAR